MTTARPDIYKVPVDRQLAGLPYKVAHDTITDEHPVALHHHELYEIFLVTEGPVRHLINDAEYELATRSVVLIRPDDLHTFRCARGRPSAQIVNVPFVTSLFRRAGELLSADQIAAVRQMKHGHAECLMTEWKALLAKVRWLEAEYRQHDSANTRILIGLVLDVVSILTAQTSDGDELPYWLRNAMNAMQLEENYLEGVPRLVELSGHSAEHVSRTMRRHLNRTPSAFVNQVRLQAAAHLLKTTEREVTDIIFEVGYESASHFNREFRKYYGVTARNYRNRAWNIGG
ncbi:helix-turn-helix transcriptional regulator [Kiritimatiella glycovorans]|uniref:AraC family trancriptional regulator n=1 Tax=Kiritimatiella glycovorans TaxID=1307763 RepID=A0A0G3EHI8_9BACT|nr:AraC family transcriptional regulator [Kiritimatiella glycovorans]AKJ63649.1 AraC family trancriptional regulator [Kiritimatiella glycovorans]